MKQETENLTLESPEAVANVETRAVGSSAWLGSDPLCMYCANREGCMPYNDEDLAFGADSGHVPTVKEGCTTFRKIYKNEAN